MNGKFKSLMAASALLAAGNAFAGIDSGFTDGIGGDPSIDGSGDMFISLWNQTDGTSATFDTGMSIAAWEAAYFNTPGATYTFDVSSDPNYAAFMSTYAAGDQVVYVVQGTNGGQFDPPYDYSTGVAYPTAATGTLYGYVFSSPENVPMAAPLNDINSGVDPGVVITRNLVNGVNMAMGPTNGNNLANNSSYYFNGTGDTNAYVGGINTNLRFQEDWDTYASAIDNTGTAANETTMNMYYNVAYDFNTSEAQIRKGAGQWTSNNGVFTYAVAGPVVVPVPAAVWLLGSGLIGLVGVARRRNDGAAV
jgi:hypothetical protein